MAKRYALVFGGSVAACALALVVGVGAVPQQSPAPGAQGGEGAARPPRPAFGIRIGLPPVVIPDEDYLEWPLTPAQQAYARIDGRHMKDLVRQVVAFSEKSRADGHQYWGRIAGTPYDAMTRAWVVDQFKRIGLEDIHDQPVTQAPMWWPNSWEASVVVGGKRTPLKTAFALGGPSTPVAGVDLPIVWVGLGTAADFAGRDVRGKAVMIYAVPTPSRREHSALWLGSIDRARKAGAGLVIVDLAIPGMPDVITQPVISGFGAEDAPSEELAISVGPGESDLIREMIGRGESPSIHYRLDATMKTGPSGVVLAKLSGTTDENILLEAHTDTFFSGAMDNASGVAQLLALAEYYAAQPKAQRRRTLLFVVNNDHHSGSAGLAWIREHWGPQLDRTVVDFNCEHPAQTQTYMISGGLMTSDTPSARRINLGGNNGTAELRSVIRKTFKAFGVATYSRPDGGDGDPAVTTSSAPPRIGVIDHTFYHTSMDTTDFLPARGLEQATRAYASIIDQLNAMDMTRIRLPKGAQPVRPPR